MAPGLFSIQTGYLSCQGSIANFLRRPLRLALSRNPERDFARTETSFLSRRRRLLFLSSPFCLSRELAFPFFHVFVKVELSSPSLEPYFFCSKMEPTFSIQTEYLSCEGSIAELSSPTLTPELCHAVTSATSREPRRHSFSRRRRLLFLSSPFCLSRELAFPFSHAFVQIELSSPSLEPETFLRPKIEPLFFNTDWKPFLPRVPFLPRLDLRTFFADPCALALSRGPERDFSRTETSYFSRRHRLLFVSSPFCLGRELAFPFSNAFVTVELSSPSLEPKIFLRRKWNLCLSIQTVYLSCQGSIAELSSPTLAP